MLSSSPNPSTLSEHSDEDSEPVFQAPWEARAFALVNQLTTEQVYSWSEWTDRFVEEISAAEAESSSNSSYYERWVQACEELLLSKGILDIDSIEQRIKDLLIEQENKHDHKSS